MKREKIGVYGMVPIALLQDEKVKPNMLKVYAALASFQGGGNNCWPSVAAIAERSGMKPDAVCDATDALEQAGWVRKTRRANERKTNVYEVLVDVDDTESEPENPDNGETPNSEKFRKRANSEKFRKPSYDKKNNREKNTSASTDAGGSKPLSPMKDTLANDYQTLLTEHVPADAWSSIPQERKQLNKLAANTRRLSRVTESVAETELPQSIVTEFLRMRRNNPKSNYWANAPVTPSGLVARWDSVVASLAEQEHHRREEEEALQRREEFLHG